jgi:hypothetical protein
MDTFLFLMGVVTLLLVFASFLTGMKYIKVKFRVHRAIGIAGLCCASVHGLFMLYFNLF